MRLQQEIIAALRAARPDCLAIYRFGSFATVDERDDSDLDLAILPGAPLAPLARWELAQQLAALVGRDVDLVDLLSASTVMRMQVIAHGERLYCGNEAEVERFEDRVFAGYARLNDERRLILEDVQRRGSIYGD